MDGTYKSKALMTQGGSEFIAVPAACPGPCCEGCMGMDEIVMLETALALDNTMTKAILPSVDGNTIVTADTESMEAPGDLDESTGATVNVTWEEALVFDTVVSEAAGAPVAESTVTGNIGALEEAQALDSSATEAVIAPVDATLAHVSSPVGVVGKGNPEEGQVQSLEEFSGDHHNPGGSTNVTVNAVEPTLFFPSSTGGSDGSFDPCICAICLDRIKLVETAQIKGCEHFYCVTCILRWAVYKASPWCPQCRLPFMELYLYRALDGSLHDYLFEESVCLLLRASWFKGLPVLPQVEEFEDYHDEEDCFDDYYFKSDLRIGNRRWGDNGYVRAGRLEARPIGVRHLAAAVAEAHEAGSSSARGWNVGKGKEKTPAKEATGRRAKRAQKRQALDKLQSQQQQRMGKSG